MSHFNGRLQFGSQTSTYFNSLPYWQYYFNHLTRKHKVETEKNCPDFNALFILHYRLVYQVNDDGDNHCHHDGDTKVGKANLGHR